MFRIEKNRFTEEKKNRIEQKMNKKDAQCSKMCLKKCTLCDCDFEMKTSNTQEPIAPEVWEPSPPKKWGV